MVITELADTYIAAAQTCGQSRIGSPEDAVSQGAGTFIASRTRVRARGVISTHARVMSFDFEATRKTSSGPSNVTSITMDQGVRSQNLKPRQWTIEMTQFAVRKNARTEPDTDKKAEQGIDDVLNFGEIEQPEDGR